jgi:ferredoxin
MKIIEIYFSPTETTKKIVHSIGQAFVSAGDTLLSIDLTNPRVRETPPELNGDLCIVGAPCYEARIPPLVRSTLKHLNGAQIPTVALVVYGNRTIGVSLKQLVTILNSASFRVFATGTCIGEHSYATPELPLALHRPDEDDLRAIMQFTAELKVKMPDLVSNENARFIGQEIPGRIETLFKFIPEGFLGSFASPRLLPENICTRCGLCVQKCPTEAISPGDFRVDMKKCLRCMACVKCCPVHARPIRYRMSALIKKFMKPGLIQRRQPRFRIYGDHS